MPRVQGMIQRLEHFTSKLSGSDDKQILRLRHGKILKGAYKGTRKGRFKHWIARPLLSKEAKEKRIKYLEAVTSAESKALAKELCADISKRTPVPYEVGREVTVNDVKTVLEASQEDREEFSRTVRQFVSSSATASSLRKTPIDAARKRLDQALMDRSIRHHEQIKQLHREVLQILNEQKKIRKSRRKPLVEGGAPLELNNLRKLKREVGALIQEKMLSLALFREAQEYAMKEQVEELETTPQKTVSDERRQQLLEDFVESPKPKEAARESVALLAARHMLNNGFEVDKADIPDLDIPEQKLALDNEIERLRERNTAWADEVAVLLEAGKYKEARIVEDLARDSEAMKLLGNVRNVFADNAWDKFLNKQRKKVRKGKKLRIQSPNQKRIHRRGPSLRKVRPQTYLDRIRPWRGDQTRVATAHAKQMITRPQEYDGNVQGKEGIVEQTLGMLQAKYRELAQDHNAFQLQEIRDYLEKNIHDRRVAVTEPVTRMKRPLDGIPLDTGLVSPEDDQSDSVLPSTSDTYTDDGMPHFDTSQFETGSVVSTDSGNISDLGKVEDLDDMEGMEGMEDDVFEPETTLEAQDTFSDLVDVAKKKLRPKSVSDLDDLENKDDTPRQRSNSTSASTRPEVTLTPMEKVRSKQRTNWYSEMIKPDQRPPPLDDPEN